MEEGGLEGSIDEHALSRSLSAWLLLRLAERELSDKCPCTRPPRRWRYRWSAPSAAEISASPHVLTSPMTCCGGTGGAAATCDSSCEYG